MTNRCFAEIEQRVECQVRCSIILTAFTFGSIYLFSTSISLNKKWMKNKTGSLFIYELVNGTILTVSGIVIATTIITSFKKK